MHSHEHNNPHNNRQSYHLCTELIFGRGWGREKEFQYNFIKKSVTVTFLELLYMLLNYIYNNG